MQKEAENLCGELRRVKQFDDNLAMKSEHHSINCRIAIKIPVLRSILIMMLLSNISSRVLREIHLVLMV